MMRGGEKEQMGKWAARLSFLLVIALFCFLCVGSATADSYTYTLSGGLSPETPLVVDDDLEVRVNEKIVFIDNDKVSTYDGRATWNGAPIPFSASPGEVLRIRATNPGGIDIELSPLYLHVNGQSLKLSDGVPLTQSNESDFFDESFTISLPPPLVTIVDFSPSPVHGGEDLTINVSWENVPTGWKVVVGLEESELNYTRLADDVSKQVSSSGEETFKLKVYPTAETHTEAKVCACFYNEKEELKILDKKPIIVYPNPPIQRYLYILLIVLIPLFLLLLVLRKRGTKEIKEAPKTPPDQKLIIERAIYDPCERDFIASALPRMKEWINRYDPGAYWFAVSIQNNTDRAIEAWGVELEFSSALKIQDAKIEGIEIGIPHEAHLDSFRISVPKEYGIVIPRGGAQRVYFKLRAEKPKTTYEISGVFRSEIGEVPIRTKEFKYLCDAGVSPDAIKAELKKTFSEIDAARLALSFKTVQEIDRMCNQDAKTEEYLDKLSTLKNYTKGFSAMFTKQVDEFSRFMKEEQLEYLDDAYKGKVRRFCTNLIDVWTSEFLR